MEALPPSRTVRTGHALVVGLFFLALAFGVLALASVGVGLVRHGHSLFYGDTLRVPLQLSPDDVDRLSAGVELTEWPKVNVEVTHPTARQMLLRSATDFGPIALVVAGLWQLRGFMRSVGQGDPFGRRNARRLRILGLILLVGAPAVELMNYSLRMALYNLLPPFPSLHLGLAGFSLPVWALLGSLAAFILAEVFSYGVRLREDVEGTI